MDFDRKNSVGEVNPLDGVDKIPLLFFEAMQKISRGITDAKRGDPVTVNVLHLDLGIGAKPCSYVLFRGTVSCCLGRFSVNESHADQQQHNSEPDFA